ncbi:MAG: FAD binding domain-containing protein [bacterium]|nr:FAD binding domain-containing protein [bacterium]
MYPPSFDLTVARSVAEAVAALAEGGEDARILAGGQSLIPMLKLRFAAPTLLVDINEIAGLDTLERANGHLRIGATVRHADLAASTSPGGAIAAAAPWVADPLVRNRGTLCGSVAHCDPEGDWNSVLLATGATVVATGPEGERSIDIGDFVVDFFTNSLDPGEMVTEVRVPQPAGAFGGAYMKLERKVGDYATVGVAAHLELAGDGIISAAGIGLTSVAPINRKATEAEALLVGEAPSDDLFAAAAEAAAAASEPRSDVRGSAEWKRNVVRVYTRRGLDAALAQAQAA